jgi:hypothetical protein
MVRNVDRACAERQMEVSGAALVIVKMNVFQAGAISGEDFVGGIEIGEEVAVADVKVEPDFGQRVEDFA